jgi:ATP-binding cassette subfamily F protein uup
LVLDEPTNDLDIETLDLLQDILGDYDGTVLLVSHDRDFLDRVATTTVAMEGDGRAVVYAGGWTDYRAQRGDVAVETVTASVGKPLGNKGKMSAAVTRKSTLSFTEKHRLEALPGVMDALTGEIAKLEDVLSDADLFSRDPGRFSKATALLATRQTALAKAEEEWLALSEKADA